VFFMGSRFGDVRVPSRTPPSTPPYAARMAKIRGRRRSRHGRAGGCLYGAPRPQWMGWSDGHNAANQAIADTVTWLKTKQLPAMSSSTPTTKHVPVMTPLDRAGHAVIPIMIACNRGSRAGGESPTDCQASSDLNIHLWCQGCGKPWLESEGVPDAYQLRGGLQQDANYDTTYGSAFTHLPYKALAIS